MTSGTYTDVEGRVSQLEDIKPCSMFRHWIHAVRVEEKFKDKKWQKERKQVTICVWGNHGVKIDKEHV